MPEETTTPSELAKSGSQTRILTVANQKGGVGKTTTAVNLAASLGEMGCRVLLIDLDPQANATTGLGLDGEAVPCSMYEVLLQGKSLTEAVLTTAFVNVQVAPATLHLVGAEVELVPALSRETRLKQALADVHDRYDYIFIDCPPSLGLLTLNGLVAAREILVPIQCEYYALEGVGQLVRNTELVRSALNPDLAISTVVLTMYDARTKLSGQVAEDVRSYFGDKVCQNVIPRSVRLSEAPSFGQPITVFDPLSRGALAYRNLAEEIHRDTP